MSTYEEALASFVQNYAQRQERMNTTSPEMDSTTPLYQQALTAQSRSDINYRVRQSVDYDEQGLLDKAVVWPGRLAHQFAAGFVDSTADMVELPELLVNAVGDRFGWDETDRINVLGNVADVIRSSVTRDQAQKGIAEKIAYYVGYSVPDLVGMLAGGLGGAKVATRVAATGLGETAGAFSRAALKKTLKVSAPTAAKVGQVMGTIGYGTLKGGAFGGTEGALHAARDFTAMEVGMWAFSRYSRPLQIIGNAAMMGFLTASSVDKNRPDYEDEILANAILGGMFAAVGPGKQRKILEDTDLSLAKTKAYIARQKALGKEPNLNEAIAEFANRDWGYLHQSYRQDPRMKAPIQDLHENLQRYLGDSEIPKSTSGLTKALTRVLMDSGSIAPDRAITYAEQFVRSAELLSDPSTPGGPAAIKPFLDAHRDLLLNPTPEGVGLIENTRITTPAGTTMEVSRKVAEEYRIDTAKRELERRRLDKIQQDQNSTPKGLITRAYDALVNPEGRAFNKLLDLPLGQKLQDQIKYKAYDVFDGATAKEASALSRVGFENFTGEQRVKLDELVNVGLLEDRFLYDEFKGKIRIHEWSPEMTQAKKKEIYEWVEANEGKGAIERYHQAADALFQENQLLNKRRADAGIISQQTLRNYTSASYLPNGRAPRWRQNKPLYEVESSLLFKDDPIFKETFSFDKVDPRLKGDTGDVLIHDAEYLLRDRIRKTEYEIAKNNLLRSWWEVAQANEPYGNEFARMPKERFFIKGSKKELTPAEAAKIRANNDRLTKAAKEARKRRLEKIESGEYAPKGKKEKPQQSLESIQKEIKDLKTRLEKEQTKYEKTTAHAQGDFTKYDVNTTRIEEFTHPKDVVIHDDTPVYREARAIRDEIQNQIDQLESLNKRVEIETVYDKMEGFKEVTFLKDGKPTTVMLSKEALEMINLNQGLSKQQAKIQRVLGFASGTIPVKLLATAINPIFPIRRWWADNLHFYISNPNERGNILSFMKSAMMEQPGIFKDVVTNGPLSKKYSELGLNRLTVTKVAKEDILFRNSQSMLPQGRGKTAWNNFVDKMGWLGTNIETTIRLHQVDKMVKAGMSPERAVRTVNDMLNFSRKGNLMRWIDSVYPFANVAAQALDAQLQAAKTNPKLFGAKMAQYWGLRLSAAAVAYAVGSEVMDQVSPYQKVNNFIVPLGATTEDKLGDKQHAYMAIPTENSPLVRAIDSLMFGAIDIMRDRTNTLDFETIITRLAEDVPIYDVSGFAPTLQAYKAIFKNQDPRTGDNIWRGSYLVDPSLRYYSDTSGAAVTAAQMIPGASPVGLERAASQFQTNPLISFFGYMLSDTTAEERNSMTRTVTEAVPGLNSVIKWTKPQMLATRVIQQDGASHRQKVVGSKVDYYTDAIQQKTMGLGDVLSQVRANKEMNTLEKQDTLRLVRQNLKGWEVYQKVKSKEDPEVVSMLPSLREWQAVGRSNSETQAMWYYRMKPQKGDPVLPAFMFLAKSHGMVGSPKFFYYLRQAEKNSL